MAAGGSDTATAAVSLRIEQLVPAPPARVFRAWTEPEELLRWWGPAGVDCVGAKVDLRVGGRYHIANRLPDGRILDIRGVFEVIEQPSMLVYTWNTAVDDATEERVEVRFRAQGSGTMVSILHERIPTDELRDSHEHGWSGCLAGLVTLVTED